MDEAARWVFMSAPALITALAAIAGFRAWHWQLVAKRQFEVAEQAMTVAERTTDALSRIRRIFITREELVATEVPDQIASEEVVKALRRARAVRKRIDEEEAIFAEARTAQIVANLHLSAGVGLALQALFDARRDVLVSTSAYAMTLSESANTEEQRTVLNARIRECENIMWETRAHDRSPIPDDKLSARIDSATVDLAAHCEPYLRLPTFWEFVWRSKKATR